MARFSLSFPIFFLLLLLSLYLGKVPLLAKAQLKTWCVAKPPADDGLLQSNIDYSCKEASCAEIQPGAICFNPDNKIHHASFAMNSFYQTMGRHKAECDFRSSGLIALTDPSYGTCIYPGGDTMNVELTRTWCVAKPATSDTMLQANIDFACSRVDCSQIKSGGYCFNPNTLMNHASFAMNLYFESTGKPLISCDFNKTAIVVTTDPSDGSCIYGV